MQSSRDSAHKTTMNLSPAMVIYLKEHDAYKSFLVKGNMASRSDIGEDGLKTDRAQGSAEDDESHIMSMCFSCSGNDKLERLIAPQKIRNCKTKTRSAVTIRTGDIKGDERREIDIGRVWKSFQPVRTLLGLRRKNKSYCSMSFDHRLEETLRQSFRTCNQQFKAKYS